MIRDLLHLTLWCINTWTIIDKTNDTWLWQTVTTRNEIWCNTVSCSLTNSFVIKLHQSKSRIYVHLCGLYCMHCVSHVSTHFLLYLIWCVCLFLYVHMCLISFLPPQCCSMWTGPLVVVTTDLWCCNLLPQSQH